MSSVEIGDSDDGSRFDKTLAEVAGLSRAGARALIDAGDATLNGATAPAKTRVAAGDTIAWSDPTRPDAMPAQAEVPFDVVAQLDRYLVVSKPAGVVVHPGSGVEDGTLVNGLLHRFPDMRGVGQPGRWGIVHRLDKDTSGLMLVALTEDAYQALGEMLRRRLVRRMYTALVAGHFETATGTIEAPIRRDPARPTRMAVHRDGRPARTHYRRIDELGPATLLEVTLDTGRTHQIRVHLSSIGHPVVGDRVYGGRDPVPVPRVFLHASRLELDDPFDGSHRRFTSPLPDDLAVVLTRLRSP